jgi:hypothetical protein
MGILEDTKAVASALQAAHDVPLYQKFMGLYGNIMETLTENKELRDQVADLTAKLELVKKMDFRAPFYYQDGDEVPFCQRCFEHDRKGIHLVLMPDQVSYNCRVCNSIYTPRSPLRSQRRTPDYGGNSGEPDGWMGR